jgi:hypothetical protein
MRTRNFNSLHLRHDLPLSEATSFLRWGANFARLRQTLSLDWGSLRHPNAAFETCAWFCEGDIVTEGEALIDATTIETFEERDGHRVRFIL